MRTSIALVGSILRREPAFVFIVFLLSSCGTTFTSHQSGRLVDSEKKYGVGTGGVLTHSTGKLHLAARDRPTTRI